MILIYDGNSKTVRTFDIYLYLTTAGDLYNRLKQLKKLYYATGREAAKNNVFF